MSGVQLEAASSPDEVDQENGKETQESYKLESENVQKTSLLVHYLNWSFETGFYSYMLSALVLYLLNVCFFAFLLIAAEEGPTVDGKKHCIANYPESDFGEKFSNTFTLSWTTFSTVGYGQVYPELDGFCGGVNFITSIESLCGVLFAGFCGAILFGKVQNVYSRATVDFSHFCVMRYNEGVEDGEAIDDYEDDETDDAPDPLGDKNQSENTAPMRESIRKSHAPHPVLLFRAVNTRANHKKGSITNVDINVVIVKGGRPKNMHDLDNAPDTEPRRQFRNVNVEPSSVPLFDKILYVRHVLQQDSPLLKNEIRKRMKKNHGRWPPEIDTAEKIRGCFDFTQMIVSLEGISDVSKSTVYSQKVYDISEIRIGWRFSDMTKKTAINGELEYRVDFSKSNVVEEQKGGGGERLEA